MRGAGNSPMSVHSDVLVLIYVIFLWRSGITSSGDVLFAPFHRQSISHTQCVHFILLNSVVFRLQLINFKSYVNFVKPTHWIESLKYRFPISLCSRSFSVCPRLVGHNKIRHVSHRVILSSLWVLARCQSRVTCAGIMTSVRILEINCTAVLVAEVM